MLVDLLNAQLLPCPLLHRVADICYVGDIGLTVGEQENVVLANPVFHESTNVTINLRKVFDIGENLLHTILFSIKKSGYDPKFYFTIGHIKIGNFYTELLNNFHMLKSSLYFKEVQIGFDLTCLNSSMEKIVIKNYHRLEGYKLFYTDLVEKQIPFSFAETSIVLFNHFLKKVLSLDTTYLSYRVFNSYALTLDPDVFKDVPIDAETLEVIKSIVFTSKIIAVLDLNLNDVPSKITIQPQHIAEAIQYFVKGD